MKLSIDQAARLVWLRAAKNMTRPGFSDRPLEYEMGWVPHVLSGLCSDGLVNMRRVPALAESIGAVHTFEITEAGEAELIRLALLAGDDT